MIVTNTLVQHCVHVVSCRMHTHALQRTAVFILRILHPCWLEKAIYTRISFQTVTYSHILHLVAPLSLRHDPILTDDVILKGKNSPSCWKVTQQDFHKSKAMLLLCSAKVTVAYWIYILLCSFFECLISQVHAEIKKNDCLVFRLAGI